jgi:hypothetical protein
MNTLLRLNLWVLLAVAVFDPADLLVHAKVPLFAGVWILLLADMVTSRGGRYPVPTRLYWYLYIFVVLLPLVGMLVYVLRGGRMEGYEGFGYYKSYLFLTLCIPLAMKRIDLVRSLSMILSVLSLATVALYAMTFNDEALRSQLWLVGDAYGFLTLTERTYAGLTYPTVYFYTSSLLVVAVAYFCYRSLVSVGRARFWNVLLLLLNECGMLLSGTRNNIIIGLVIPLMVIAWYKGTKARLAVVVALAAVFSVGLGYGAVQSMLSPNDISNAIKVLHYQDYMRMFGDWRTLLFGQGLGASFFSTALGTRVSVTELTYLEFIRSFGLIIAAVYYGLLLFPVEKLRKQSFSGIHYLLLAYASYLLICASNPLLLSSSGMLVLAIVLAAVFPVEESISELRQRNYGEHLTPASL